METGFEALDLNLSELSDFGVYGIFHSKTKNKYECYTHEDHNWSQITINSPIKLSYIITGLDAPSPYCIFVMLHASESYHQSLSNRTYVSGKFPTR